MSESCIETLTCLTILAILRASFILKDATESGPNILLSKVTWNSKISAPSEVATIDGQASPE